MNLDPKPSGSVQDTGNRPMTINLPPLSDPVSNCNSKCVEMANNYERECEIMRKRIEQALDKEGCPSTVCKKESAYANTSTTTSQGCNQPTYGNTNGNACYNNGENCKRKRRCGCSCR